MKKVFLAMFAATLLIASSLSLAGGLSQDPEALSFLGSYEGTLLARGNQRSWELALSAVDDSGNVKVSRFWQGAVGRFAAEDIALDVKGLFQRENGKPQIVLEVPERFKMKLTKEEGGLFVETLSSGIGTGTSHLKRK